MQKVYINFMKRSGTTVTAGHRSSNGWVTCWKDYVRYNLTFSSTILHLPLDICEIIREYISRYPDYEHTDSDWGVQMSSSYNEENIGIYELIQILNSAQSTFEFEESPTSQPFHVEQVLNYSLRAHHAALEIIKSTKYELNRKIQNLQFEYKKLIAKRIYNQFKLLIEHNQVDFNSKYADLEYYPLDIIAINKDYDLLVKSIITHNPPFALANDIYIVLSTGRHSYFDIRSGLLCELSNEENQKLSDFIKNIEKQFADRYIQGQNIQLPLQGGMTNLVMHYLLNKEYENYDKLMTIHCYKSIEKNTYKGFKVILKLAYISDCRWDKITLDSSCNDWDSDSRLIRESLCGTTMHSPYWVPFLKRILDNNEAIEKLYDFFHGYYNKYTREYVCERIQGIINEYE